jgi:hypothetical protein
LDDRAKASRLVAVDFIIAPSGIGARAFLWGSGKGPRRESIDPTLKGRTIGEIGRDPPLSMAVW